MTREEAIHWSQQNRLTYFQSPTEPQQFLSVAFLSNLKAWRPDLLFRHYCGFLVLRGKGSYLDWAGNEYPLVPGVFAQHLPGKPHSIRRDLDTQWAECSFSLHPHTFKNLATISGFPENKPVLHGHLSPSLLSAFSKRI